MVTMKVEANTDSPMEKIIKAYLALKFPDADMEALYKVIYATGNESVATEMLAGLYIEPAISVNPLKKTSGERVNPTFISYDPFKKEVKYSFNRCESTDVWKKKSEDSPLWENRKMQPKGYYVSDIAKELGITEEEVNKEWHKVYIYGPPSENLSIGTISLSDWQ